jgi:hypothetical protein
VSLRASLLALVALGLAVPAGGENLIPAVPVQATQFYSPQDDGSFILETGIAEARERGGFAVIVFGADWCHDSVALAKVLTSQEFETRFGKRFSVSFIDVGTPQTGKGRNLDLVAQLGLMKLRSTPAMFVVSGTGKRLNSVADARAWRNADSRGKDKTLAWFEAFLAKPRN